MVDNKKGKGAIEVPWKEITIFLLGLIVGALIFARI